MRSATAEEAAAILEASGSVIIVPGYGMAVAQAQHDVHNLANILGAACLALVLAGGRVSPVYLHITVVLFTTLIAIMVAVAASERGLMMSALGYTWTAVYVAFFFRPDAARAYDVIVLGADAATWTDATASAASGCPQGNTQSLDPILFTDRIEHVVPPRKGRRHALRLMRDLLAFEPTGTKTDVSGAMQYLARMLRQHTIIFIISDFLDAENFPDVTFKSTKIPPKGGDTFDVTGDFTMHGVTMVWFFLIPSIPAVLGNFLIPMMIGAKDLAFPRINLLSWYLYVVGGLLITHVMLTGGVDTGWTFYTPLSTEFLNTNVISAGLAVFLLLLLQQALVDQRSQQLEHVVTVCPGARGDALCGGQREAADERSEGRDMLSQMANRARTHIVKAQRRLTNLRSVNEAAEEYVKETYGMDIGDFRKN